VSAYETLQLIAVLVIAAVFGLSAARRRYPHVAWLQAFSNAFPRLPEDQRRKARKREDFYAGAKLILLGVALPVGYAALTMMMFSSPTRTATVLVWTGSLVCIGLGIIAIWHSRRQ
jgi:hypothetical protein